MLVVAGAGTGKTTVLIRRIASLIRDGHARPDEIIALTYTDNAAVQMRERLSAQLGKREVQGLQVCTFHAYCNELLIAADRKFGVLDDKQLWIFLRKNLRELKLNHFVRAANVSKFLDDLLDFTTNWSPRRPTATTFADWKKANCRFRGSRNRKMLRKSATKKHSGVVARLHSSSRRLSGCFATGISAPSAT
jgi:superfamily I DNA/RNA helicase